MSQGAPKKSYIAGPSNAQGKILFQDFHGHDSLQIWIQSFNVETSASFMCLSYVQNILVELNVRLRVTLEVLKVLVIDSDGSSL